MRMDITKTALVLAALLLLTAGMSGCGRQAKRELPKRALGVVFEQYRATATPGYSNTYRLPVLKRGEEWPLSWADEFYVNCLRYPARYGFGALATEEERLELCGEKRKRADPTK